MNSVRISVLLGLLTFSFLTVSSLTTIGYAAEPSDIQWVTGPAKADLGNHAEIQIPAGYRFAKADDARMLLKKNNNPAPDTLAGILAPNAGKWMIVFEFTAVGFVKDSALNHYDSDAILQKLRQKIESQSPDTTAPDTASSTSVRWQVEPQFDNREHTMEWAIQVQTATTRSVNHFVRLLGREGVLDGIAVQSGQSSELIPLKQLMAGVSFKPGHAYADYSKGDNVSTQSLAELITADSSSESRNTSTSYTMAFVIGGVVLVIVGAGIILVTRKARRRNKIEAQPETPSSTPAPVSQANGSSQKLFKKSAYAHESSVNGNGHARVNGNHNKGRRRKVFNYQKYYSDLMFQVSNRSSEITLPVTPRNNSPAPKPVNGNGSRTGLGTDRSTLSANLGLIEGQKNLIEEQQRLICEQSKLIEEKFKVIQEKHQLLEKQSELFGNNIF